MLVLPPLHDVMEPTVSTVTNDNNPTLIDSTSMSILEHKLFSFSDDTKSCEIASCMYTSATEPSYTGIVSPVQNFHDYGVNPGLFDLALSTDPSSHWICPITSPLYDTPSYQRHQPYTLIPLSGVEHGPQSPIPCEQGNMFGVNMDASHLLTTPSISAEMVTVMLPTTPPTSPPTTLNGSAAQSPPVLLDAPSTRKRKNQSKGPHHCPHPDCDKTFSRPYNLKSHMRTHSTDRPFACTFSGCKWRFARPHDLKRHSILHLDTKPHACSNCKRRFARVDAIKRHWKSNPVCAQHASKHSSLS